MARLTQACREIVTVAMRIVTAYRTESRHCHEAIERSRNSFGALAVLARNDSANGRVTQLGRK